MKFKVHARWADDMTVDRIFSDYGELAHWLSKTVLDNSNHKGNPHKTIVFMEIDAISLDVDTADNQS